MKYQNSRNIQIASAININLCTFGQCATFSIFHSSEQMGTLNLSLFTHIFGNGNINLFLSVAAMFLRHGISLGPCTQQQQQLNEHHHHPKSRTPTRIMKHRKWSTVCVCVITRNVIFHAKNQIKFEK